MERWSDGEMVRWSDGAMARWSDGAMAEHTSASWARNMQRGGNEEHDDDTRGGRSVHSLGGRARPRRGPSLPPLAWRC